MRATKLLCLSRYHENKLFTVLEFCNQINLSLMREGFICAVDRFEYDCILISVDVTASGNGVNYDGITSFVGKLNKI